MNRSQTLEVLARAKPELARRYGVARLALFGSTARDEARLNSDVDIVVAFDGTPSFGLSSCFMFIFRPWQGFWNAIQGTCVIERRILTCQCGMLS